MFTDSKYTRWYFGLIGRAILRKDGDEFHHIIPHSIGGCDDPRNLVKLTLREHFVAHLLLTKMPISSTHRWKMHYALTCFMTRGESKIGSRRFEQCKRFSKSIPRVGYSRPMTDETKQKLRLRNLGKKQTKETKEKRAKVISHLYSTGQILPPTPQPSEVLRQRYFDLGLGEKLANARKSSTKWKEAMSSNICKNKKMMSDPRRKPITIEGIEYPSLREAAKRLNMPYSKVRGMLVDRNDNVAFD